MNINDFKNELSKNANSLQDVFDITAKHFDCTKKLGIVAKSLIVQKIDTLITLSGVKPK